jgi:hypothetical protein
LMIFWTVSSIYGICRTFLFDPYCNTKSVHYDKNLNAFEKRRAALREMNEILELEGIREESKE